ncbi:MAG: LapA family protein [Actinomycetota bacterium]
MTGLPERGTSPQGKDTPNLWAGPLFFLLLLLTPTLILIFSNTGSAHLKFASWEWSAPLWLILLATFAAGIVLSRGFGWIWRVFRRRRQRIKTESLGGGPGA